MLTEYQETTVSAQAEPVGVQEVHEGIGTSRYSSQENQAAEGRKGIRGELRWNTSFIQTNQESYAAGTSILDIQSFSKSQGRWAFPSHHTTH